MPRTVSNAREIWRSLILGALLTIVTIVYSVQVLTRENIVGAANKLGNAMVSSNADVVYDFLRDEDRKANQMSPEQFHKFWDEFYVPRVGKYTNFKVIGASSSGIMLVVSGPRGQMSVLVSGNDGQYSSPFLMGFLCLNAIESNRETKTNIQKNVRPSERFHNQAIQLRANRSELNHYGIKVLKVNIKGFRTIDEMALALESASREQAEKEKSVAVKATAR
ncbi:MAG: hypothetical protein WCI55_00975 [Armatimonadota bacterium]